MKNFYIKNIIMICMLIVSHDIMAFQMSQEMNISQTNIKRTIDKHHVSDSVDLQIETHVRFYKTSQPETDTNHYANDKQLSLALPVNNLQMDVIQARILSRKGLWPSAKTIYKQQVKRNPKSSDVHAGYAELLIENKEYDEAFFEIEHLLALKKDSSQGFRLKTSIFDRMNMHTWTFPIYEKLLKQSPDNSGLWFDYANQRYMAGQWQQALNAYERVLEHDPDHIYALRGIHSILKERRPAFKTQLFRYESSDGSIRSHQQFQCRYTINNQSTFFVQHETINVHAPDNEKLQNQDISQTDIEMTINVHPKIILTGRYQIYQGIGDGISTYASVEYNDPSQIQCQISWLSHYPWYDPIQAMTFDSYYNDFQLVVQKKMLYELYLNTSFLYRTYYSESIDKYRKRLNDYSGKMDNYGKRLNYHIGLSKKVWIKPDTTFSLTLDQADFSYATDNHMIPMVLSENVYALSAYIQDQTNGIISYFLSFGYRWDSKRSLAGFSVNPGINLSLTRQCQVNTSYAYSSESTGVISGSTQSLLMEVNVVF
jgi:tetratricopeptide (TPR) repeat protein